MAINQKKDKISNTHVQKNEDAITRAYCVDKSIIHQKERKPIFHVDPTEYL